MFVEIWRVGWVMSLAVLEGRVEQNETPLKQQKLWQT